MLSLQLGGDTVFVSQCSPAKGKKWLEGEWMDKKYLY